jgi:hypothetical protein
LAQQVGDRAERQGVQHLSNTTPAEQSTTNDDDQQPGFPSSAAILISEPLVSDDPNKVKGSQVQILSARPDKMEASELDNSSSEASSCVIDDRQVSALMKFGSGANFVTR